MREVVSESPFISSADDTSYEVTFQFTISGKGEEWSPQIERAKHTSLGANLVQSEVEFTLISDQKFYFTQNTWRDFERYQDNLGILVPSPASVRLEKLFNQFVENQDRYSNPAFTLTGELENWIASGGETECVNNKFNPNLSAEPNSEGLCSFGLYPASGLSGTDLKNFLRAEFLTQGLPFDWRPRSLHVRQGFPRNEDKFWSTQPTWYSLGEGEDWWPFASADGVRQKLAKHCTNNNQVDGIARYGDKDNGWQAKRNFFDLLGSGYYNEFASDEREYGLLVTVNNTNLGSKKVFFGSNPPTHRNILERTGPNLWTRLQTIDDSGVKASYLYPHAVDRFISEGNFTNIANGGYYNRSD